MDILIINASPKIAENNSGYFINEIKSMIGSSHKISEVRIINPNLNNELIQAISSCNTIIIAFPLYVDSIPSHLTNVLTQLSMEVQSVNQNPIRVFGVVNCGFYEAHQTHIALQILKNWCYKSGFKWCQGIGIGAGEMYGQIKKVPLGHGPKKSLGKALTTLTDNILDGKEAENMYISPDFPRILFKLMADSHWNSLAKSFGNKKKDLLKNTL
ncbi:MAG: hypothetical protein K0S61_2987 [Anaerocolumna sp.]|jgi:multimeric flavodoxin WrbA|nr:hypothetical protein [Anaerocolumna sp.]